MALRREESAVSKPRHACFPSAAPGSSGTEAEERTTKKQTVETWSRRMGALQEETRNSTVEGMVTVWGTREWRLGVRRRRQFPMALSKDRGSYFNSIFPSSVQCMFIKHKLCSSFGMNNIDRTKPCPHGLCILAGDKGKYMINTVNNCCSCLVTKSCPTLQPHGLQHARPPCPSPTPGVYSNSCPSSRWCLQPSHPLSAPSPPASVFPSIRAFSNESALRFRWPKYWSFSVRVSPSSEFPGLISFKIEWFNLFAFQGTLKSLLQHQNLKASVLWHSTFFMVKLSKPYITIGKTVSLTI